jgi:iron complex outermembrane recepter protein
VAANVPQVPGAKGSSTPSTPRYKLNGTALYTFHFAPGDLTLSATGNWRSSQYSDIPNTAARIAPAYGTVDLHAQWNDSMHRYTILAYVKNVGNTISDQFFLGFPTGGGLTALNPPRTYGIELQYRFQ